MFSWKRALPQETTASTDTPANSLKPSSVNGTSAARVLLIRKDRKSTRLNSSHSQISYAVFCLKKKKKTQMQFANVTAYTDDIAILFFLSNNSFYDNISAAANDIYLCAMIGFIHLSVYQLSTQL